ncbi:MULTISPECIES: DUF4810 domain-containing protein [Kordiimonas]|uniref:DUF4810 domain-containing protein n=1 Tax=Kordiimonas TaxID=288021 RepID=UPI00257AF12D|nr:DUF4810 domain-containing protein [Kordiimonas sp. UBA4487]
MNIKHMQKGVLALALVSTLAACGPETMYQWEGYDYALLKHYKDGTASDELALSLQEIIEKIERKDGQVPPGLYADYGYALYDSGNVDEAMVYFAKERDAWPESAPFMTSVIDRLSGTSR